MQTVSRLSHRKYREDIFAIDALLQSCLGDRTLLLHTALQGISLRTLILGESFQSSGGGMKTIRSRFPAVVGDNSTYLSLHFSRFFEAAPWIRPPDAPRPLLREMPTMEHLKRFGLLLTEKSPLRYREIPGRILGERMAADPRPMLTPAVPGGVIGFQIISEHPLEFILTKYGSCEIGKDGNGRGNETGEFGSGAGEFGSGLSGRSIPERESSSRSESPGGWPQNWKVEVFLRQGTRAFFFPGRNGSGGNPLPNEKRAKRSAIDRQNNEPRRKKMVFRQGGRPAIRGRLIHQYFQCL